jgi:hypothetical protein
VARLVAGVEEISVNVATSCRRTRRLGRSDDSLPLPDRAAAGYFDREIRNSHTTAEMCTTVAQRARWQGRTLVAAVLHDFAAEFADEAAFLTAAADPDVRWPCRAEWHATPADLDEAIDAIRDGLANSERTLRWIARRPDLPASAAVAFEALASARHARRRVLRVCNEVECL